MQNPFLYVFFHLYFKKNFYSFVYKSGKDDKSFFVTKLDEFF